MICFQISIFEPLETTLLAMYIRNTRLWFAFKLVSLNHWKQPLKRKDVPSCVVICFQISIFEPLETTIHSRWRRRFSLWFAFKLVSLNHWKQPISFSCSLSLVVICFQISIFEPLETTYQAILFILIPLWFAFKLVSLNHWKQHNIFFSLMQICCDLLSN